MSGSRLGEVASGRGPTKTDSRDVTLVKSFFGREKVQHVAPADMESSCSRSAPERSVSLAGRWRSGRRRRRSRRAHDPEQGGARRDCRLQPSCGESVAAALAPPAGERSSAHRALRQADRRAGRAAVEKTPSYAAVVATAAYSGGRIREVLAIRWCDIDSKRRLIHLRGQISIDGTEIVAMKTAESSVSSYSRRSWSRIWVVTHGCRLAGRGDDYVFAIYGSAQRSTPTSAGRSRSPPRRQDSAGSGRTTFDTATCPTCCPRRPRNRLTRGRARQPHVTAKLYAMRSEHPKSRLSVPQSLLPPRDSGTDCCANRCVRGQRCQAGNERMSLAACFVMGGEGFEPPTPCV